MIKNNNRKNIRKRAFVVTQDEKQIFRYDVRMNQRNFIEHDMFMVLTDMDKAGLIELKKVFNMLKVKYGMSMFDSVEMLIEPFTKKTNWQIIPTGEINEFSTNKISEMDEITNGN